MKTIKDVSNSDLFELSNLLNLVLRLINNDYLHVSDFLDTESKKIESDIKKIEFEIQRRGL